MYNEALAQAVDVNGQPCLKVQLQSEAPLSPDCQQLCDMLRALLDGVYACMCMDALSMSVCVYLC